MTRNYKVLPQIVQLVLTGPKSILPHGPVITEANIDQSWFELLNGKLKLKHVTTKSKIFACTRSYIPSNPKSGQGFRSALHYEISHFIRGFAAIRKRFCVRLCDPKDIEAYKLSNNYNPPQLPRVVIPRQGPSQPQVSVRTDKRRQLPQQSKGAPQKRHHRQFEALQGTSLQPAGRKPIKVSTSTSKNLAVPRRCSNRLKRTVSAYVAPPPVVKVETTMKSQYQRFADESSIVNGLNQISSDETEDEELRNDRIPVEDVKTRALESVLTRFSNGFMLHVKDEIQKMDEQNSWGKNKVRAPLACHLLQLVFK